MVSFGSSKSKSSSQQQSRTFVDPQQAPFLQNLRAGATQLAQQQLPQVSQVGRQLGGELLGAGGQALGNLQGIQGQLQGPLRGQRAVGQAASALQQQAFGQNPQLGEQIGQLGLDIGRQFSQQILPGIQSEAIGFGQLGGGREGVAQGLGIQASQDAFQRGATDLRSADIQRRLEAAGALGGLGLSQQDIQSQALQAAGGLNIGGLGELGNLFNLGLAPFAAEFGPLQQLAGIIGDPTILSKSTGTSTGKASGFDVGIFQFGGSSTEATTS